MVSNTKTPFEENKQIPQNQQQQKEVILWRSKRAPQVCIEGYVHVGVGLQRTKSLTNEDLNELKGCLDLGFGFNYDEIPQLCPTLPALELCYSMSRKFLSDDHNKGKDCSKGENGSGLNLGMGYFDHDLTWKISTPGDHPEDVKARIKFWAQAVACTVKLCS